MFRATQPKVCAKEAWLLTGAPGEDGEDGAARLEEILEDEMLSEEVTEESRRVDED